MSNRRKAPQGGPRIPNDGALREQAARDTLRQAHESREAYLRAGRDAHNAALALVVKNLGKNP